jgi:hypothetical protein
MRSQLENDLIGVLRALKAAGPAAAPAIQPLKRFLEKARHPLLVKHAYDALGPVDEFTLAG